MDKTVLPASDLRLSEVRELVAKKQASSAMRAVDVNVFFGDKSVSAPVGSAGCGPRDYDIEYWMGTQFSESLADKNQELDGRYTCQYAGFRCSLFESSHFAADGLRGGFA
eukprot:jgi/Botrbrau1/11194/Bobra.0214s0019.1